MGNMAQMNGAVASITGAVAEFRPLDAGSEFRLRLFLGLALSASAGIILAGDAKRVGKVTTFLVPLMSGAFLLLTLLVIICHAEKLPGVLGGIVREAFLPRSALGAAGGLGLREALHWGVRRGAFSNEAGLGSAAIAHGSARAGLAPEHALWGIFEVFADTILLCTLTALAHSMQRRAHSLRQCSRAGAASGRLCRGIRREKRGAVHGDVSVSVRLFHGAGLLCLRPALRGIPLRWKGRECFPAAVSGLCPARQRYVNRSGMGRGRHCKRDHGAAEFYRAVCLVRPCGPGNTDSFFWQKKHETGRIVPCY